MKIGVATGGGAMRGTSYRDPRWRLCRRRGRWCICLLLGRQQRNGKQQEIMPGDTKNLNCQLDYIVFEDSE